MRTRRPPIRCPSISPSAVLAALALWAAACGGAAVDPTGAAPPGAGGQDAAAPAAESSAPAQPAPGPSASTTAPAPAPSTQAPAAPAPTFEIPDSQLDEIPETPDTEPADETAPQPGGADTPTEAPPETGNGQDETPDDDGQEPAETQGGEADDPGPGPEPAAGAGGGADPGGHDPDALLPGEETPDVDYPENPDPVGDVYVADVSKSVLLSTVQEACPPSGWLTGQGFTDCEDYVNRRHTADYFCVFPPLRMRAGFRYQKASVTAPFEGISDQGEPFSYASYTTWSTYTVLGLDHIPPDNEEYLIWFGTAVSRQDDYHIVENHDGSTIRFDGDPLPRSESARNVAVGGPSARQYDADGNMVSALVSLFDPTSSCDGRKQPQLPE